MKWTEQGLEVSVQCEVMQTGPRVLGGRRILPSTPGVGRGQGHSHLFGLSLSTFLSIILGDHLLGTHSKDKFPFF